MRKLFPKKLKDLESSVRHIHVISCKVKMPYLIVFVLCRVWSSWILLENWNTKETESFRKLLNIKDKMQISVLT